jgi:3-phenylpropionate/cinnamic acid dioxygenase small subunit
MTPSIDDQRAIEALLIRYATAADMRDAPLLTSCFTEDVRADYGDAIGRFNGRDALVGHLAAMLGTCGPTLHYIGNVVLAGEDDEIRSRCYTHAVVHIPNVEAPIRTAGVYDDRLRRTADGWRIADRTYSAIA